MSWTILGNKPLFYPSFAIYSRPWYSWLNPYTCHSTFFYHDTHSSGGIALWYPQQARLKMVWHLPLPAKTWIHALAIVPDGYCLWRNHSKLKYTGHSQQILDMSRKVWQIQVWHRWDCPTDGHVHSPRTCPHSQNCGHVHLLGHVLEDLRTGPEIWSLLMIWHLVRWVF